MKKHVIYYSLLFLFSLVIIGVGFFPAERALSLAEKRMTEFNITNPSGTALCGKADTAEFNGLNIQNLQWHVHVLSLLIGQPSLTLEAQYLQRPQHLTIRKNNAAAYALSDTQLQLALTELPIELPRTFQPKGLITTDLTALNIQNLRPVVANGRIDWQKAYLGDEALGAFHVTLETVDDVIKGKITGDDNNALKADGKFSLKPDGRYVFDLTLQTTEATRPDLRRTLSLLGQIAPDGRLPLHLEGNLLQLAGLFAGL